MCLYCEQIPVDVETNLCPFHLDLEVLVEYLKKNGTPATVDNIISLIAICQSRNGSLVITPDDLPDLITDKVVKAYGIEMEEAV